MKPNPIIIFCVLTMFLGCSTKKDKADASGSFEAVETIVSAQATGNLLSFTISEGEKLTAGQLVGVIDTSQLYLTKKQLLQSKRAILSGRPNVNAQIASLQKELENAIEDRKKIAALVEGGVASQKQLDDADARISVLKARIDSQSSTLGTTTSSLNEQASTTDLQLALIEDQLRKCRLVNPVTGLVLSKYAEPNELTTLGKPLYKIANTDTLILGAFVTGSQLPEIKIGQNVKVRIEGGDKGYKYFPGVITWVSDKSEFTPKTIQTKDERANLVYAIKVVVKNDGYLKIGMYGEVVWRQVE